MSDARLELYERALGAIASTFCEKRMTGGLCGECDSCYARQILDEGARAVAAGAGDPQPEMRSMTPDERAAYRDFRERRRAGDRPPHETCPRCGAVALSKCAQCGEEWYNRTQSLASSAEAQQRATLGDRSPAPSDYYDERLASWMALQDALPAEHPIQVASGWRTMLAAVVDEDARLRAVRPTPRAALSRELELRGIAARLRHHGYDVLAADIERAAEGAASPAAAPPEGKSK